VLNEVAVTMTVAKKEAMDKRVVKVAAARRAAEERAAEEAAVKRAAEERAAKEAAAKATAAKEVAGKTTDEATVAVGGSLAPNQVPTVAEAKRVAAPPRQPNVPTWVFRNLSLSSFLSSPPSFFSWASFSDYTFSPMSSPSSAATTTGMAASAVGIAATDAAIGVTPGPTPDGEPWTPEGVP
jgi:hypothetical protein